MRCESITRPEMNGINGSVPSVKPTKIHTVRVYTLPATRFRVQCITRGAGKARIPHTSPSKKFSISEKL